MKVRVITAYFSFFLLWATLRRSFFRLFYGPKPVWFNNFRKDYSMVMMIYGGFSYGRFSYSYILRNYFVYHYPHHHHQQQHSSILVTLICRDTCMNVKSDQHFIIDSIVIIAKAHDMKWSVQCGLVKEKFCDGVKDCPDGSDESDSNVSPNQQKWTQQKPPSKSCSFLSTKVLLFTW